uniref:Uncharacterized protein n=1 Tax=Anguilla anguilla TaxID=7936 RepID=A0A0E9UVW2_ANGAN
MQMGYISKLCTV